MTTEFAIQSRREVLVTTVDLVTAHVAIKRDGGSTGAASGKLVGLVPDGGMIPIRIRVFAAAIGTGLVVAGAVAVFVTANSVGAAALVASGTVVGFLAMFADRVQSFEGGGVKFELGAAIASRLQAADDAEQAGDEDRAMALRDEARLLMTAMKPISAEYEDIRQREGTGGSRTAMLERIVRQAKEMALSVSAGVDGVEQLFDAGSEGNRISAIAIMQAKPEVASKRIIINCIRCPRSGFEQYHALRAAEALIERQPDSAPAREVRAAVEQMLGDEQLSAGSDRMRLARRVLASAQRSDH